MSVQTQCVHFEEMSPEYRLRNVADESASTQHGPLARFTDCNDGIVHFNSAGIEKAICFPEATTDVPADAGSRAGYHSISLPDLLSWLLPVPRRFQQQAA